MLKRRYEKHPQLSTFLSACGQVSGRLKHTVLACLTPPKVQTQSRFMNVHRLVRWADRVLGLCQRAVPRQARCWRSCALAWTTCPPIAP